jgi:hypothetical protein
MVPFLNRLDAIAAMFVTGVADEKTAFQIFGRAFCGSASLHYDIISVARSVSTFAPYSNIVELYKIWSGRLSKSELEKSRQVLDEQIRKIPDKSIAPLSPMPKS